MQHRIELPAELRTALWITVTMLVCAEVLGLLGAVEPPHAKVALQISAGYLVHDYGSLALHFVLLFAFVCPGWRAATFVAVGGFALDVLLLQGFDRQDWGFTTWLNSLGGGFGVPCLAVFTWWAARGDDRQRTKGAALLAASMIITVYVLSIESYLRLVGKLHPLTYDFVAHLIDGTFGFQPSETIAVVMRNIPGGQELLSFSYRALPYAFPVLFALQLRDGARFPANVYTILVTSAIIVTVLYQFCPIAGPYYAFGTDFPLSVPAIEQLPHVPSIIRESARNGMPSMHLGWSLLLWMNAGYVGRWARAGFAVLVGLTVLATLGLGEHYLVDLVAGVPAAVALQALCTRVLPWQARERRNAVLWGAALTAFWMVAVRFGVEVLLAVPGLTWVATLVTLAACVALYRPLARASCAALELTEAPAQEPTASGAQAAGVRREVRAVGLMFVLSGFAGLVYQVLFSKALALSFGSTAIATYTVLATYMGGMALGAWLGGRLAAQRADALKLYAYCELGIGVYCLATPWIFQAIQSLYVALAAGTPADAAQLTVLRVLLGATALSVPTVLMGMTLPILARFFQRRSASLGTSVALLYGANTMGAALGALLAGYLVIPGLGMFKTTLAAALLNLVVAALALRLFGQLPTETAATPLASAAPVVARPDPQARRLGGLALVLLALGGVVTLALEVNYIHLLAVVAGNSVYAFSLMLFAFLLGLAGGAEIARWLLASRAPLALCLAWIEFALAAAILLGVYQWSSLPGYFASFAFYPVANTFGTRELIRGLV